MKHSNQINCEKNHNKKLSKPCDKKNNDIRKSNCEKNHTQLEGAAWENSRHVRLNKAIAAAGYCSRRKADELIFAGKVKVNDQIELNPGTSVCPEDKVEIEGKVLTYDKPYTYLLLNKPIHCICTASDPQKRQSVFDLLPENLQKLRLFTVGRLDYFSEGLLLLTNDGQLAYHLTHPKFEHPKRYEVIVKGKVEEQALEIMRRGMKLEDGTQLLPVVIDSIPLPSSRTMLKLELRQGINRQIRRMCEQLKLTILKLKRTEELNIKLGALEPGKFRFLNETELSALKQQLAIK